MNNKNKMLMRYFQWFLKFPLEKKVSLILMVLLLGYVLSEAGIRLYYKSYLKKENKLVLALIYDVGRGKSGAHYHIKYNFDHKSYTSSFKPSFNYGKKKGDYIFIKILERKPTIYDRIDFHVPRCAMRQQLLDSVFTALPANPDDLCN